MVDRYFIGLFSDPAVAWLAWQEVYHPRINPPTTTPRGPLTLGADYPPAQPVTLLCRYQLTKEGIRRKAAKEPPFDGPHKPPRELTSAICADVQDAIGRGNVHDISRTTLADYFDLLWVRCRRDKALRESLNTGAIPKVERNVAAAFFKKWADRKLPPERRYPAVVEGG